MVLFHAFVAWLVSHSWATRMGAKWRHSVEPGAASTAYISPGFLRFCILVSIAAAIDLAVLIGTGLQHGLVLVLLMAFALGAATGSILGRLVY